jgi:hypothetical protein
MGKLICLDKQLLEVLFSTLTVVKGGIPQLGVDQLLEKK